MKDIKSNSIKNILYLHANNTDIGGADFCLFKLASSLDRNKFRPFVALSLPTSIIKLYERAGIPTKIIKMKRLKRTENPFYIISYFAVFFLTVFRIYKFIKKENIELVHSNDFQDIYGALASRLAGALSIQHIRLIMVSPKLLRIMLTMFIGIMNNRIITVSDGVARSMFSRNGKFHKKVVTCYDWLDMDAVEHARVGKDIRREFNIPENAPLIGVVGRLEHWKGQHVIIKASPLVVEQFPEARFMIIGGIVEGRNRERYSEELKKLASEMGTLDRIIFTGHRNDIANVMSSLDIFVHTSVLPDPLPGVVMEAMLCARPVIGSNAGGVPEEIENGATGLLYAPGDHVEMAEAILYLLKNPAIAREMGQAGKMRAIAVFSKETLMKKMEEIYYSLLAEYDR
ncbi:glycosyltransferase family 4 protein [Candidatus Poribacteria bacterium]|nr:glycosyltransferase family 4 protein [Candidatus Poribacteria bacterium]